MRHLPATCAVLIAVLFATLAEAQQCLEEARQQGFDKDWISSLKAHSRSLPKTYLSDLGSTDWEGKPWWDPSASGMSGNPAKAQTAHRRSLTQASDSGSETPTSLPYLNSQSHQAMLVPRRLQPHRHLVASNSNSAEQIPESQSWEISETLRQLQAKVTADKETTGPPEDLCRAEWGVIRYKLWKGVLYSFSDDHTKKWWKDKSLILHRNLFVEKLLAAMYLYKGFAEEDTDFFFCLWDVPCQCGDMNVPFLQHTVISLNNNDNQYITPFNPATLVQGLKGTEESAVSVPYTKGYVIPNPQTWIELSLSSDHLKAYSQCVLNYASSQEQQNSTEDEAVSSRKLTKTQGPPSLSSRIPNLFWRGGGTGAVRGWEDTQSRASSLFSTRLSTLLLNKRVYLTLLARPFPWLDVGIHKMRIDPIWGVPTGTDIDLVVHKDSVPLEDWSKRALVLSIDGFASPWRLPQQFLGSTPVVKVESPYKEAFTAHFKAGTHYEAVKYDLSDFVSRTGTLLAEVKQAPARLEKMAEAAREQAIKVFNFEAQMDSFVWSCLQVRKNSPWKVKSPYTPGSSKMGEAWTNAHWETPETDSEATVRQLRPVRRARRAMRGTRLTHSNEVSHRAGGSSGRRVRAAGRSTYAGGSIRAAPSNYGKPPPVEEPAPLVWNKVMMPRNYSWGSLTLTQLGSQIRQILPENFE